MLLSDAQRNALPTVREALRASVLSPYSTPESVEQRARRPDPATLPSDITVGIEIAPPSLHPDPILQSTGVLKTPERVPLYFFSLRNSIPDANSNSDSDSQDRKDIANTRVIFYIHGGGNVTGHPTIAFFTQYYAHLLRAVASQSEGKTECVLVAPSYRLATAPENVFPAALQDIVAAYDYVLGKGYKASNIVVAGASAGGNHAVVLTHLALQSGRPPHGVVPIVPASLQMNDLSDYAQSLVKNDIVSAAEHEHASSSYVGDSGIARTDPLVSGSLLPFTTDWPKTLILVGNGDQLIDASRELKNRLAAIGRPVELVEYDERPHGWWILPQIFPEDIRDSAERIARLVLE